jgi:ribosomal protein S6E (S10)
MHELSKLGASDEKVLALSKGRQRVLIAYRKGYRVDEDGEVISPHSGERMKATANTGHKSPRRRFTLRIENGPNGTYPVKVHQLAAYQAMGDEMITSKLMVCHRDENELNNRMENLYLGTQSNNMMDQEESVRIKRAKHAAKAQRKLSNEQVAQLREDREKLGMTLKQLKDKYKLAISTISGIVNYKTYPLENA